VDTAQVARTVIKQSNHKTIKNAKCKMQSRCGVRGLQHTPVA
jgi:hypothetical protein